MEINKIESNDLSEESSKLGNSGNIAEKTKKMEKTDLVPAEISENTADAKERAKKKLQDELKNAKDKSFADLIITYLLGRCEEDKCLSEDVLQKHKTWAKCLDYICSLARKQSSGNCAAVRDEVVYEWAEDYYHKDDKAEEEKKAREAAERRKRQEERTKNEKVEPQRAKEQKPKEEPNPKKNSKDMDGQLDIFSIMGI